jgi:hypothetical protein
VAEFPGGLNSLTAVQSVRSPRDSSAMDPRVRYADRNPCDNCSWIAKTDLRQAHATLDNFDRWM